MFDSLLQTKLYMPPIRPHQVERRQLLAKLTARQPVKLVLVSAPAGYGKTTLVSSWLQHVAAAEQAHVCWLAVDEDDSDPRQFFRYLAAAVRSLPDSQAHLPRLLQSTESVPAKTLMKAFIQDTTTVACSFYLVLDDYHALDAPALDAALATLLELMPPQMTLVLTSRSDPGFPLARLRVRGELTELRAEDLRFSPAEAAQFLQQTMDLTLLPQQVSALERRTEGWIAGLQMAALSLQRRGQSEQEEFVQAFTGGHRFVLDYLVEEVLSGQSEDVRTFLLSTAILDRLNSSLCDAVTGRSDSQGLLATLERTNLFVVPLDDQRRWYRYHHLFADVLHARALQQQPQQLATLHRRASEWYAAQDALPEAVRHALAAEDFARAADLIERIRPQIDVGYQSTMWLGWVQKLPDTLVRARPVLSVGYAWALLDFGEMAACAVRLRDAEAWLTGVTPAPAAEMVVADESQFATLPASIAAAWAYHDLALGDVDSAVQQAERALELAPQTSLTWRHAAALLGLTYWTSGDLTAADRAFSDFTAGMFAAGNVQDAISATYVLADIKQALGHLRDAARVYVQALQHASAAGDPPPLGTADLHRGLSEIWREGNELERAAQALQTAATLGEADALTAWQHRLCLTRARLAQARGDLPGAFELLDAAERHYLPTPLPDLQPVAAWRARLWASQGDVDAALDWARAHDLAADDALSYLREFEHITLARVLIARYRCDRDAGVLQTVQSLLERLLTAAEAGGRSGSAIEILMLQALTDAARGDSAAAMAPFARSLALAEPEGYVRIFVDEGEPMAEMLATAVVEGVMVNYARKLLAAFDADPSLSEDEALRPQPLVDPLSARELEILALIAAGLKNQEIAGQLVISLNTVLYHNKNIYSKLGVGKRTLAVARARELGLLD